MAFKKILIITTTKIISLLLTGLIIFSDPAFASAGYTIRCALAAQSAFKPLASVIKTETGFAIVDDEALLREAEKGFKKDAEILYLNFLKEQAEAVGLSRDGVKRLIHEHLEEVDFWRATKDVTELSQRESGGPHTYVEVKGEEKDNVLSEISHTTYLNIMSYYERLLKGYNSTSNRSAELDLKDINEVEAKDLPYNLDEAAIFPHGLLRDEDGILWIVKKRDDKGYENLGAKWKNLPARERLAYLVSKNRSNSAEIRLLSNDDVKRSPGLENIIDDTDAYYLVRVVTEHNLDKKQLPHQDLSRAYSSIFIASIFIRKHDHHPWNCVYTGNIPVSVDNDMALGVDISVNPRDGSSFRRFMCRFLYHSLFLATRIFLRASVEGEPIELPSNQYDKFVKDTWELMHSGEWSTKFDQILDDMNLMIKKFGLADSFISAEMLDEHHMRRSILEFKGMENIYELAMEAGYRGEELDSVVKFITETRKTLGRDVNDMLKFITGKDYGFDKLDEEYAIRTGSERGQEFIKPEPIAGIDLWQERDIVDIDGNIVNMAEALEEMAKDIEENGIIEGRNFKRVEEEEDVPDKIKMPRVDTYRGCYEYIKGSYRLQIIKKEVGKIGNIRLMEEFFSTSRPWCCPVFFVKGDQKHVYELNLTPLGYSALLDEFFDERTGLIGEKLADETRISIRQAVSNSLRKGEDFYAHTHLHVGNILVKRDNDGRLTDIKIIDWKFIEKGEMPVDLKDFVAGKRNDLVKARLRGAFLEGFNFEGIDLTEADLTSSHLAWTNFKGAKLKKAHLAEVFLEGADLSNADLRGANLSTAVLAVANLNNAVLEKAGLSGARLHKADLSGANLKGAYLREADLTGADLRRAYLMGADFCNADLGGADLRGADLRRAYLRDAKLFDSDLSGADLRGADLRNADCSGNLRWTDLRGADLRGTSLCNADLTGVNLRSADLRGADLEFAFLFDADLRDAEFIQTELQYALMQNVKFNKDKGKGFEAAGFQVVYKKDYCIVTSPEEMLKSFAELYDYPVELEYIENRRGVESKWGQTFTDTILWRAHQSKKESRNIIIGLDTSWIPERQIPYIQELLSRLNRLSGEKGLGNIIVVRGKGEELGADLSSKVSETETPLANVVVLGDHKVLESESFDSLRPGVDPEKWAFFAGVELPEDFPNYGYIRLLEMLTISLNLAFGKSVALDNPFIQIHQEGKRMFRLIPRVEPFDYELLQEIYKGQLKAMRSA